VLDDPEEEEDIEVSHVTQSDYPDFDNESEFD
jgi:hypothetical protein